MAEIIQLREIQAARERTQRRLVEHRNLERAVGMIRKSLVVAAERLERAPAGEQEELIDRIEKLAAMVRYGIHLLGENAAAHSPSSKDTRA
jgi:hypothetical protein